MASLQNILLVGSTGTIGTAIRKALLAHRSHFKKLGVLTSPASVSDARKSEVFDGLKKEGVEVVVADLDDKPSLVKGLKGWDAVICALAPPIVPKQANLVDAAVEAGVSRFYPSEFGFDLTTPFNSVQPAYKFKVQIQNQLKELAATHPNFSYTLISNGSFADFIFDVPPMVFEIDPHNHTATVIGDPEAPTSYTSYEDVGNFTVAVLLHPEETKNKLVCVEGQRSSWAGIIRILEKLQGVKYTVKTVPIAEAEVAEKQAWAEKNPAAVRMNLRRCMGTGNAQLKQVDNDKFPEFKATTDLETIAKKALVKKGLL